MTDIWTTMLLVCVMYSTISSEPLPVINLNMPECEMKGTSLFCDFKDTPAKEVELRDVPSGQGNIGSITIKNVPILRITRNICSDITLNNIPKVRFLSLAGCSSKAHSLTLTNSNVERIPRKMSRLTLTDSEIDIIRCDLGIQRIFSTRSRIGEIDSPWPIGGSAFLRFESTKIEKIVQITIQERVTLLMKNTVIEKISEEAIKIGDGCTLLVHNCTFSSSANQAVVLKSGSKLSVQDVSGKMNMVSKVPGKEDIDGRRAPGVPPKQPLAPEDERVDPSELESDDCQPASPLMWVLPTVLATAEALIILWLYSKREKLHLFKIAANKDSETGYGSFDVHVDHRQTSAVPEFYQQAPGTDLHRLRKR